MDDQIAQFVSLTSSTPQEAQSYLAQAGGNLETAVGLFFAASDDADAGEEDQLMDDGDDDDEDVQASVPARGGAPTPSPAPASSRASSAGGNSMGGGASEPLPAGWGQAAGGGTGARVGRVGQWGGGQGSTPATTSGGGPRIATLGSLNSGGPAAGQGPAGDDDDSDEEGKGEDLYAGGERSGLNIQNPNKGPGGGRGVVNDILKKAKEAGPPPSAGGPGPSSSSGPAWGSGNTLGSDTTPSTSIPDPSAPPPRNADDDDEDDDEDDELAVRHLTFWKDGFSIEDGELRRYDQPGNRELLEAINQGRAPPSLLNVRINQPVEVRVAKRLDEEWKPAPPKPKGPWEGSGNRLGAVVPTVSAPAAATPAAAAAPSSSTTGAGSSAGGNLQFEVDLTEPTTQLQIRLGDGTRLVAKVNFTHTIGDVRRFINASRPGSTRSYALQTTFPNKDLADETQTIKEANLAGAVVVQRWT